MPNMSINTNAGAMIALQNLNKTNNELQTAQTRINTGLKVASAKDNGAVYAIATRQRSDVSSLGAVTESLDRAKSAVDVALSAGESVADMLTQMKEKALAASDTSLTTVSRQALNEDFKALRDQISKTVNNATFNGVNLIKNGASAIAPLANADGSSKLTVAAQDLSLTGSTITLSAGSAFTSAAQAKTIADAVDVSIANVSAALGRLGTSSKSLDAHAQFVSKLVDSMESGIGNLVDADLAKESAKLQALQTKQQLGVQALSIANQAPGVVTRLFQ
ncbi:flagellin [Asticcacaulis excentricus]|uniref:Flagellin n=1 Tax=Asticcacaulis excentricus (strain ATCC 15261 / DSM 4724 / KCTC 12464 / NCIMB 9791 / VKM B-1370 / CB 48) TaxID=573065 RepID=E8RTC3_ASTEC|nr:flagellin [Asticcacaulis excentricus]ADU14744.1 flagellin domain protein [Asticcacaulis excentricus CB 48]